MLHARSNNATIEVIIESDGFNNSLAGYLNCPNSYPKGTGVEATTTWVGIYLKDGKNPSRALTRATVNMTVVQRANYS